MAGAFFATVFLAGAVFLAAVFLARPTWPFAAVFLAGADFFAAVFFAVEVALVAVFLAGAAFLAGALAALEAVFLAGAALLAAVVFRVEVRAIGCRPSWAWGVASVGVRPPRVVGRRVTPRVGCFKQARHMDNGGRPQGSAAV